MEIDKNQRERQQSTGKCEARADERDAAPRLIFLAKKKQKPVLKKFPVDQRLNTLEENCQSFYIYIQDQN